MPQPDHWFELHMDCSGNEFDAHGWFASRVIDCIDTAAQQLADGAPSPYPVLSIGNTSIGFWALYSPGDEEVPKEQYEREFSIYVNCDGIPFAPDGSDRRAVLATTLRSLGGQLITGRWNGAIMHELRHTFGNWKTKWSTRR